MNSSKYILVLIAVVLSLAACSRQDSMLDMEAWDLVWISDSSGWGVAEIYAAMIEEDTGIQVNLHDNWMGGLSAGDVYHALQGGPTPNLRLRQLADQIREAEVIVFYANPDQSIDATHPGDWDCVSQRNYVNSCEMEIFSTYIQHLEGIYESIFDLRAGQPTIVRAYDAYSPRIDEWREQGVFDACKACWGNYNAAIHQAAESYHVPVAAVAEAWNGINRDEDPNVKGYTRDSEHPNEKGGEVIAESLRALGYDPVRP